MKKLFNQLRSAILFITILPAGRDIEYSPMGMIKFFPVVGLLLGALLLGFDSLCSYFWPPGVVAFLDVVFLVAVTGAFHLDGLGDTADGLFSHRPKQRMLEIMKDSRTGMMGLVAIFCVLGIKIAGIYSIKTGASPFQTMLILLIVPAYARGGKLFGFRFLKYGRKDKGTGKDFFEKKIRTLDFLFILIPVVISLFLGYKGLVLNAAFVLCIVVVLQVYRKTLNCITGDMLGAMTEITEAFMFLAAGACLLQ